MQFHDLRGRVRRRLDLATIRFDEERHANARGLELVHERSEPIVSAGNIQPPFCRHLLAPFGNKTYRMRTMAQGYGAHLASGGHFEIERSAAAPCQSRQPINVVVRNVTPILSK